MSGLFYFRQLSRTPFSYIDAIPNGVPSVYPTTRSVDNPLLQRAVGNLKITKKQGSCRLGR